MIDSNNICMVAICKAKPDRIEDAKAACLSAVPWSTAEAGCVEYKLHVNRERPNEFVFYEVWKDQAALESHNNMPQFKALIEEFEDFLAEPATVILMERMA